MVARPVLGAAIRGVGSGVGRGFFGMALPTVPTEQRPRGRRHDVMNGSRRLGRLRCGLLGFHAYATLRQPPDASWIVSRDPVVRLMPPVPVVSVQ